MPVRRDPRTGGWFFRTTVKTPDGKKLRIFGTAGVPGPYQDLAATKVGAQEAEQRAIKQAFAGATGAATPPEKKEVPTFAEWFNGRFWTEWVVARKNKPSGVESKLSIYRVHLGPAFDEMPLDEIDVAEIARFRAKLIGAGKSDKTINNVLAVLSKVLKYAEAARVIPHAPSVGLLKVERPEIIAWNLEEYARLLAAAQALDPLWFAAVCLAGEAGLRIGEIRALDWRRDVDLIAGTLTINQQTRRGKTTTPKGRTRRTVPMTETLRAALKVLDAIRTGFVIRNPDGTAMTDNQTKYHCYRICWAAGLPEQGWHTLRHAYGTHAAMFGANPWKLMQWMGHKRIDETMLYVHFAAAHLRPLPEPVLSAQRSELDPDRRIIVMLDARRHCGERSGENLAKLTASDQERLMVLTS